MVMRSHPPRGFTLVEVLTVIAVISIILGLMIPVIGDVAAHSRCLQGQTNLRTMGHAARTWCIEHNGRFPPGMLTGTDEDSTSGDVRCWDWWTRTNDNQFARPGLLWEYTDHPDQVLQCPAYEGNDQWAGPDLPTGYNYNVVFIAAMSAMHGIDGLGR
jgi:prepilin-type N-terminal cleavage/methylation domain-containing protein